MDIRLRPDSRLPDDKLYVSSDLDVELMMALKDSDFHVVIDERATGESIRMSANLVDRILEWMSLRRFSGRDDRPTDLD